MVCRNMPLKDFFGKSWKRPQVFNETCVNFSSKYNKELQNEVFFLLSLIAKNSWSWPHKVHYWMYLLVSTIKLIWLEEFLCNINEYIHIPKRIWKMLFSWPEVRARNSVLYYFDCTAWCTVEQILQSYVLVQQWHTVYYFFSDAKYTALTKSSSVPIRSLKALCIYACGLQKF
jgi:hypothetical protein